MARGLFKKVSLATQVVLAGLLITALFTAATFAWLIPKAEASMMAKKKEKIREGTEAAWCALSYFETLARTGKLTLGEAQTSACSVIRSMRYGADMKDYFFIVDMHPNMIVHPYRPDLEGKDVTGLVDPNGVAICVDFVKVARERGEGFTTYLWQFQDDETQVVPKISYVRLFKPWNWIVGTGMYVEDVRNDIREWKIKAGLLCLALTLIGVGVSWSMGRRVSRHIQRLAGVREDSEEDEGRRALDLRLQTFILFVTVPALLVVTVIWGAVLYRDLRGVILSGFDRKLVAISRVTGGFIRGEDHARIAAESNETSEIYQGYVRPMKAVAKKANLTYLYTQILAKEKPFCFYILDATEGPEHSAIGTRDELPMADYRGGERVATYGVVHVGDVQKTENWGLLKSAFAPIYNRDESVTAMAGADVNISVISEKMRVALFAVALLAVAAVLLAGLVSVAFARTITRPVNALRDGALVVAAGSYDHKILVEDPDELKDLSEAFSKVGSTLENTLRDLGDTDREMEQRKRRRDLAVALDKVAAGRGACAGSVCVPVMLGDAPDRRTASGWILARSFRGVVAWLARSPADALEALRLRSDLAVLAARLEEISGGRPDALKDALRELLGEDVRAVLICEADSGRLQCLARERITAARLSGTGPSVPAGLENERTVEMKPGERLVVSDDEAVVSSAFVDACLAEAGPGGGSAADLADRLRRRYAAGVGGAQAMALILGERGGNA